MRVESGCTPQGEADDLAVSADFNDSAKYTPHLIPGKGRPEQTTANLSILSGESPKSKDAQPAAIEMDPHIPET
jgi:hypothetical protein